MTAHIAHAGDVIEIDTSGTMTTATFSTPAGQLAIAAGGVLCGQDRDENNIPFWTPAALPMGVSLSGDTATFTAAVYNNRPMCIRDVWISYWED